MIVTVTREQALDSIERWQGRLTENVWADGPYDAAPVCGVCAVGAIVHDAAERAFGRRPTTAEVRNNAEGNAGPYGSETLIDLSFFFERWTESMEKTSTPPRTVAELVSFITKRFREPVRLILEEADPR